MTQVNKDEDSLELLKKRQADIEKWRANIKDSRNASDIAKYRQLGLQLDLIKGRLSRATSERATKVVGR